MEIFNRVINGTGGVYSVRISPDDLKIIEEEKIKDLARDVRVHGFRPGKVPANIIKNMYGTILVARVKETSLERAIGFIVNHEKLEKLLSYSTVVKKDDTNGIEAEFTVVTAPAFEIKDHSQLKFEKLVYKVTDDDVQKLLKEVMEKSTNWVEDDKHKVAKEGDKIVAHFELKGKNDKGLKSVLDHQDVELVLGDKNLVDDIWKHFVGSKVDDVCEFTVNYPGNMTDKKISGKSIDYRATVKHIFVASKYKLDDEFAKSLGYTDLNEARKSIRDREQMRYDRISRSVLERKIMEKLCEIYDFELPTAMVDLELEEVTKTIQKELQRLNKKTSSAVDDGCRALARDRVKVGFVMSKLATANSISVSKNEIGRYIRGLAALNPGNEKKIYEMYSRPENSSSIFGMLLETKVLDFLVKQFEKNSQIKEEEISADGLVACDEEMFDFIKNAEDVPEEKKAQKAKKTIKSESEKSEAAEKSDVKEAKTVKKRVTTKKKTEK